MKKLTKTLLLTAALSAGLSMPAMATNVQATLPSFPVTLNGTVIDNSYRQYPLLVYNNITYFPMTYYDCRFLGVETEWTQANGLKIEKSNLTGAYHQQNMQQKNSGKVTAQLATGKIAVNGKAIANSKEQYPLLVYRDVTYFPLTWRFAVDEFGWKYSYDNKNGLVIDAGTVKTSSVTLKDARKPKYREDVFNFAIDGKYLYYEGEKGSVYRRPLAALGDDKQRRTIKQVGYLGNVYPNIEIWEQSGAVYLKHPDIGNGHNQCRYRVNSSGSTEKLECLTGDDYVDFGSFQLKTQGTGQAGPRSGPINLIVNGVQKDFGKAEYYYSIRANHGPLPYAQKEKQIYVLAAPEYYADCYLYAMDLDTANMKQLSKEKIEEYAYADNMLYFTHKEMEQDDSRYSQELYVQNLATGQTQFLAKLVSSRYFDEKFAATKNGVYYREWENGGLFFWNKYTGKKETVNAGFTVYDVYYQNGYIVAHFEEVPENPYRLMVFAPSGQTMKQVYATADCSDKAVINADGLLVYRLEGTNQLVQVQL